MPGQYGIEKVTIQNLQVIKVDADRNILLIKDVFQDLRFISNSQSGKGLRRINGKLNLYNMTAQEIGEIELSENLFELNIMNRLFMRL